MVDRFGSTAVCGTGTILLGATIYVGFADPIAAIPVLWIYVGFMVSNSIRSVPLSALTSRVPAPHERARFMSVQSAVQHLSAALGAFAGAQLLTETDPPDKRLVGMPGVAIASIAFALLVPFLLWGVETRVRRREKGSATDTGLAGAAAVVHPAEPV
jgi:predicted MFS family arabinose efflux permease